MENQIASDVGVVVRPHLLKRVEELKINVHTGVTVQSVEEDKVCFLDQSGNKCHGDLDTVVVAVGMVSDTELQEKLKDIPAETHLLGDCDKVGRIMEGLQQAVEIANRI